MDANTLAANRFNQLLRDFVNSVKPWSSNVIYYETKPDEEYNVPLVSYRIYGKWEEYLVVMACANLNHFDEKLEQQRIVLPNKATLQELKRKAGFESISNYRGRGGVPVWQ